MPRRPPSPRPTPATDRVQFLAEHRRLEHRRDVQKAAVRGSGVFAFSGSCACPSPVPSPSSTAAFLDPSPGPLPRINTMEACAHPGGASPTFGAGDPQPKGSRGRFRQRPFWESGQGCAWKLTAHFSRSARGARSLSLCEWVPDRSARQVEDRAHQVFVARVGVDARRQDRLVPGEALGHPDVLRASVEVRAGRVPKRVEVQSALEVGALLPDVEDLPELARRQPVAPAADEHRRVSVEALADAALPPVEAVELGPDGVGQHHLLGRGAVAAALEHPEHQASPRLAGVEDVAHIEGEQLVLTQAGAEGEAEDHVVPEAGLVLAGGLQEAPLLHLGQRARRGSDVVCVGRHGCCSLRASVLIPCRRPFAAKAREAAVSRRPS